MAAAQLDRGPQPLVGEARRHPDVGDHQVRHVGVDGGQQGGRVADRGGDGEAEAVEDAGQPFAQQHAVLGEHGPDHRHGSSARSSVGPPAGLDSRVVPPTADDPIGESGQPTSLARVGAAPAVVADLDDQRPAGAGGGHPDLRGAAVLGHVAQRLGDDEVGGRLDVLRRPLRQVDRHGHGDRRPVGELAYRRAEAAVGEHLRVDAADQLA